ncbi:hypothetical protein [Solicola sp. PLA-1-18]|uniref:hypothetical protein n=1 Tax=Solicola sp. PLA-1-18 TaxID=3380532 RepID=UPI003B8055E9
MTETLKPKRTRRQVNRFVVPAIALVVVGVVLSLVGRWAWKTYMPVVQFGGAGICLDRAPERLALVVGINGWLAGDGTAKIVAIRPVGATGGLRVVAFATNPTNTQPVGTADEPISRLRGYTDDSITVQCGSSSQSVAVQLIATNYPATLQSLEVDYELRGITRTAVADYGLTFFAGSSPDDDCDDADLSPSGEADCEVSLNSR